MDRIRIRPAAFTAAAGRLATLLLPHQCVLCRQFADTTGLCATCWDGLTPIAAPLCARCGLPLGHTLADPLCAGCWTKPPPLAAIRAGFHYADSARELILHYKHGDGLQLTPLLTRLGARLSSNLPARRRWSSRYHFTDGTISGGATTRRRNGPIICAIIPRRVSSPRTCWFGDGRRKARAG